MNEASRPAVRKRADGPTALALAAGLAVGHVVAAMAAQPMAGVATIVAAFIFVASASAGTVCALLQLASAGRVAIGRSDVVRWVFAIAAGVMGALSPGFF